MAVSESAHGQGVGKHGDEFRELRAQLQALKTELAAYKMGGNLISGIGNRLSVGGADHLKEQVDLVDLIVKHKLKNSELASGIEEKIAQLDIKLDSLRTRNGVVNATFFAPRTECQVDFQFTYRMAHSALSSSETR